MRQLTVAAALAAIAALVASCGGHDESAPGSSTTTTATPPPPPPPPVAQAALAGLLLTPADIDGLLGLTGSKSKEKYDKPVDDNAKQQWPAGWKFPDECLYALNPGEAFAYAGSGYTAVVGDDDVASLPSDANEADPEVTQMVVLFPSAKEANDFYSASSQKWSACNNRQFTTPAGPNNPEAAWKVGSAANANGMLSNTISVTMNFGGDAPATDGAASLTASCQRVLTVRNNVAIDVSGCRKDPGDLAVKAANQIAGKVGQANVNLLAASLSKGYGLNNCQPAPAAKLTGSALAELDCGQNPDAGGPASAVYRLLPNADALAADFKNTIQDMALASCGPDTGQSPGSWRQGEAGGQMACGTQKATATLAWTTDGKNVLGSIRWASNDINAVHQWWLANG